MAEVIDAHLSPDFVAQVTEAVRAEDAEAARALCEPLHSADLADLIETLSGPQRRGLAPLLEDWLDPQFLAELEGQVFADVVAELDSEVIAGAVEAMETDDAVYVVEELAPDVQQEVLRRLSGAERAAIEEGLGYPEDTAGRLMQKDLVAVPDFWTVGQTIDYLRSRQEDLPSDFYDVILVDPGFKPQGMVPLSRVMKSRRETPMGDLKSKRLHLIDVLSDQEEVAYSFNKYHLISAPVVNGEGRLVGVITVDDIVHVVEAEAQEDIFALAGVNDGAVAQGFWATARGRLGWLVVNLATAILASMVIGLFEATIAAIVALAVLMPIVASMGGNAATQTMTVTVRALAIKELSASNTWRVIGKELLVALANGVALAVLVGLTAYVWFGQWVLALVLAAALVVNMVVAGLAGITIPLALERFRIDPALASGVFVTTVTDVVGFFAFLGLAAVILL